MWGQVTITQHNINELLGCVSTSMFCRRRCWGACRGRLIIRQHNINETTWLCKYINVLSTKVVGCLQGKTGWLQTKWEVRTPGWGHPSCRPPPSQAPAPASSLSWVQERTAAMAPTAVATVEAPKRWPSQQPRLQSQLTITGGQSHLEKEAKILTWVLIKPVHV